MRRGAKSKRSPPSLSAPPNKVKEDELSINEDDLEERIKKKRSTKAEVITIQKRKKEKT